MWKGGKLVRVQWKYKKNTKARQWMWRWKLNNQKQSCAKLYSENIAIHGSIIRALQIVKQFTIQSSLTLSLRKAKWSHSRGNYTFSTRRKEKKRTKICWEKDKSERERARAIQHTRREEKQEKHTVGCYEKSWWLRENPKWRNIIKYNYFPIMIRL